MSNTSPQLPEISGGLSQAFALPPNVKDVKDLIAKFDFAKLMDEQTRDVARGCVFALAPSFGMLSAESIKKMSETIKVVVAGTTRVIASLSDKSWANVVAALSSNHLLEQLGEEIHRSGKVMEDRGASFLKKADPDPAAVSKVRSWFKDLVQDDDVINLTNVDIPAVAAKIVASSSARVTSRQPTTLVVRRKEEELTVLDVGVLKYPDVEHPHFKLYRIKVRTWAAYMRVMGAVTNRNRIKGEFTVRTYKPCEHVAMTLSAEVRRHAASEAEALFASSEVGGRQCAQRALPWTFVMSGIRQPGKGGGGAGQKEDGSCAVVTPIYL